MRFVQILLPLFCLLCGTCAGARGQYPTRGECAGLPKIAVKTPPGFCVGLVADGFLFPRGILPTTNGDIWVADMGNWLKNRGSLWRLTPEGKHYRRIKVLDKLDRPNGIVEGPDGKIYVGEAKRIFRFDPAHTQQQEDVIGGQSQMADLPDSGRHPLTSFVFGADKNLYVNIGSVSDHCEGANLQKPNPDKACPEVEAPTSRGIIRRYVMDWHSGRAVKSEIYASGLRNSMALAVHPHTGALWQGENSRDNIQAANPKISDAVYPHDEINLIIQGGNYGWPYCYDHNLAAPEYPRHDCTRYRPPTVLLPAHAAPLGMMFYRGGQFPNTFKNQLIIGFHGYRKSGHRLIAYATDTNGMVTDHATLLIWEWAGGKGAPMGAPTDVKQGVDGAVYISEDRNGTIIRLSHL